LIHRCALSLVVLFLLTPRVAFANSALAQDDLGDAISSQRYIVIDAETGEVFSEKDAHDQVAIASLTKIFTTIEAIERAPLSLEITTDESDLFDESSTTMGFGPGETFTLEELLYGMMLPSGNDAAHAIARSLGFQEGDTPEESVARFVGWMNERIRNMGLTETHLVNPHGLGVPGHVSSAHDIAAFTMYAHRFPVFNEIISTASYNARGYPLSNTNRLLSMGYDGLVGGKTGFDEDSGYCLVEVAQRSADAMISVTLDGVAPTVWYEDNVVLLDYAFDRKSERLAAGEEISGDVVSFVDPDAAVVASMVTPGATFGKAAETERTPPPDQLSPTPTPTSVVTAESSNGGRSSRATIAWIVSVIVVLAAIGFRVVGTGSNKPGPRRRVAEGASQPGQAGGDTDPPNSG
jgi:D-alanyl-D-alanine carboxypeptidase (penicillin-binding protein 5/6)